MCFLRSCRRDRCGQASSLAPLFFYFCYRLLETRHNYGHGSGDLSYPGENRNLQTNKSRYYCCASQSKIRQIPPQLLSALTCHVCLSSRRHMVHNHFMDYTPMATLPRSPLLPLHLFCTSRAPCRASCFAMLTWRV